MEISTVAKQWMWKFQHPEGRWEINELHVPVGRPVRITMASEDVIHSFFVPAFRVKADVLPGRYRTAWFQATKTGRFHLFCAEYCGTQHSGMIGSVVVMEPEEYQAWLAGGPAGESVVQKGERLFQSLGCATCHQQTANARGPALDHVFGSTVPLSNGRQVVADEEYLRESILEPAAKVTAGYEPIMPVFKGMVNEEQVLQLIAYIKSLKKAAPQTPAGLELTRGPHEVQSDGTAATDQ
jgi:cytochrome c oxidase subunit 2